MSAKFKNIIFCLIAFCNLFTACDSSKKSVTPIIKVENLEGSWELNYISGSSNSIDSLYPNKRPIITFDIKNKQTSGNSGCNNFNGTLKVDGNKIDFTEPMAITKMLCFDMNGENEFIETLKKVNRWSVSDNNTLNLIMGDIVMMRFVKI